MPAACRAAPPRVAAAATRCRRAGAAGMLTTRTTWSGTQCDLPVISWAILTKTHVAWPYMAHRQSAAALSVLSLEPLRFIAQNLLGS